MKSAIAGYLEAVRAIMEAGVGTELPGDIVIAGVSGEIETGPVDEFRGCDYAGHGIGTLHLIRHGLSVDCCILGEPTAFQVTPWHFGTVWVAFRTRGTMAHTAFQDRAVNAIDGVIAPYAAQLDKQMNEVIGDSPEGLSQAGKYGGETPLGNWLTDMVKEAGGRDAVEKYWSNAAPVPDYQHESYLIRTADKEYWIHVGTSAAGKTGHIVVLEKKAMTQSLGFLDAAAMKTALDADGRVALYIHFDTDKSTLRPDSQAAIAEIRTLLDSNADLKVSIEGHTDNTGSADRNRQLSSERARSVLDALEPIYKKASQHAVVFLMGEPIA